MTNDIMKCQLKPVNFADYKVAFNDDQKARMKKTFATGVCDFSKPGVGQTPIKGTYQEGPKVITRPEGRVDSASP